MWESILRRIKNLFTYEVDEPVEPKSIKHDNEEINDTKTNQNQVLEPRTKVIYQYPKNQSMPNFNKSVQNNRSVEKDRKSTRLNSSHVSISYAVFCLIKKMQHEQIECR